MDPSLNHVLSGVCVSLETNADVLLACMTQIPPERIAEDGASEEVEERKASNSAATTSQSNERAPEASQALRRVDALVESWLVSSAFCWASRYLNCCDITLVQLCRICAKVCSPF